MTESELVLRLRDYWYIAADSRALRHRPLQRTILGQPVVIFRDDRGEPAALLDRCAHRNMRLSAGKVRAGRIECPYHGWTYARDGACVAVPSLAHEGALPNARVDSFPTLERDGFVWIW